MHTSRKTSQLDIDVTSAEPVYHQIADHLRRQVALGDLRPGARLPAIRAMARTLNLDPGTVARAYQELEREGIITGRRGRGSFVSAAVSDDNRLAEERQQRLGLVMERAIIEAMGLGFTAEEASAAFTLRLADWRERRGRLDKDERAAVGAPGAAIRFLGSHDLAVELLASRIGTLYPSLRVETSFVGSLAGLLAVSCGEADVAGAHLLDEDTGEFNIPFIRRLMPNETVVLMNLVQRLQGWMVARKNPRHILGVHDLTRRDITFVNRQKGSGTRILLDSRLRAAGVAPGEIRGYEHEENTHMAVASFIARGQADVGLGAQSAANLAGLDFIPLLKERYDLVALQEKFERPPLSRLQEAVCSEGFLNVLRSVPGYNVSETCKITIISPK
ncbi:MAG: GntR family transcriptional regulator [Chloroflexi bacterium]|nr:GntR family transcriptional regulator [Chloroflexota bacterium]